MTIHLKKCIDKFCLRVKNKTHDLAVTFFTIPLKFMAAD